MLEELRTEVRVNWREVRDPVIDVRGVLVGVEGAVSVVPVVVPPSPVGGAVVTVLLRPEDLVHRPEDTVPLPPRADHLAGVARQPQPLVVVLTLATHLGVLTQLGQADELLVKAGVLLYLVSPPGDLHFDSVLLLLFEEIVFALLVITSEGRGMPGPGSHLPAHGGVGSPGLELRVVVVVVKVGLQLSTKRMMRESF